MNIKDYREKELRWFIIANVLAIIIFSISNLDFCEKYNFIIGYIVKYGLLSGIIYPFTIIFDGIISHNIKKYIVFQWRPEPGETIFSVLRKNTRDNRICSKEVENKYREVFMEMPENDKERRKYENKAWYKIYRKHEDEKKIQIAQRDYLLCRDMSVTTLLIGIMYLLLTIFLSGIIVFSYKVIIYFGVILIICIVATNVKAKRFVITVIACDLSESDEEKKE